MIKSLLMSFSFIILLTGCLATPYQKLSYTGVKLGGYDEKLIPAETPKYNLSFAGNGATTLEKAVEYWYRRADELCVDGYEVDRIRAETAEGTIDFESYSVVGDALLSLPGTAQVSSPHVFGEISCK